MSLFQNIYVLSSLNFFTELDINNTTSCFKLGLFRKTNSHYKDQIKKIILRLRTNSLLKWKYKYQMVSTQFVATKSKVVL